MKKYKELQIVYGGQWGSEGKGQIATYLAKTRSTKHLVAVRVGGPNAGHTFTAVNGESMKVQQIPCAAYASNNVLPVIGASGMILPDLFIEEIEKLHQVWESDSLKHPVVVDELASVILQSDMLAESSLKTKIGSTGEGVGAATAKRVMRKGITFGDWLSKHAKKSTKKWLERYVHVTNTQDYIISAQEDYPVGMTLQLEGTQGYLLSLNAGRFYPFCTSRDCGPDALASQCGISTRIAHNVRIVCVMRTFPIRVGGNSGPMGEEIDWETLKQESNGYISTPEITTVTKKVRRIARWNDGLARRVGAETQPTEVAVTFADYLYPRLNQMFQEHGSLAMTRFSGAIRKEYQHYLYMNELFMQHVEHVVGAPVSMYSVGPGMIVDREPEYCPEATVIPMVEKAA